MGTTAVRNPNTNPDPDWECYLDGALVTREKIFQYTENNWPLCKFYELAPGRHTIRLVVRSAGQPFLFDRIMYKPTVAVSNAVAVYTRYDPDIVYSSNWQGLADVARMTVVNGASVTIAFTGVFSKCSIFRSFVF